MLKQLLKAASRLYIKIKHPPSWFPERAANCGPRAGRFCFILMLFGPGDCFCGPKMAFLNFTKFSTFLPKLAPLPHSFRPLKTIGLQKFWHLSFGNDLLSMAKIRILNFYGQILSDLQNTRARQQICPSNQNLATSPACFPNYSYRA